MRRPAAGPDKILVHDRQPQLQLGGLFDHRHLRRAGAATAVRDQVGTQPRRGTSLRAISVKPG
jgi:hypothetical protein